MSAYFIQSRDLVAPRLDPDVVVFPYAVLGVQPMATAANRRKVSPWDAGVIGRGCVIGCRATIYAGVTIGAESRLGDSAIIREGVRIGERCVIGTNVDIQYEAQIGNDVRILNGTHIAGGTIIGDGTFIGPGVFTANDRHIDLQDYQDRGTRKAPVIGKKVFVGVGAIILPDVEIGDDAMIYAGAVVTVNVPPGGHVRGVPGRLLGIDSQYGRSGPQTFAEDRIK